MFWLLALTSCISLSRLLITSRIQARWWGRLFGGWPLTAHVHAHNMSHSFAPPNWRYPSWPTFQLTRGSLLDRLWCGDVKMVEIICRPPFAPKAVSIGDEKVSLFPFFPVCPSVRREEAIHREISTFSLFPFSLFPVGTCYTPWPDPMPYLLTKIAS